MKEDNKRYDHREIEEKWLSRWEKGGFSNSEVNPKKKPYTISMPPPNVTDILHLGHALNNTIQDIYIRWNRMRGYEALWVPGSDHASIATQVVVEKELPEGITKEDIGREKFLEMLWCWVEKKKDYILNQLKRIGCSADFRRTKFTLDPDLSVAVREAFVILYQKGYIYRGDYVVNWCPRCETALSNEEVDYEEEESKLYYIRYPLARNTKYQISNTKYVTVATTRPETMLGDTAVAVHPDDERYKGLIDTKVILPLIEREIPVISDSLVDREFGTGVVKVTPAHDPNDFEIGERRGLDKIVIMDKKGRINENGGKYVGLSREKAREAILDDLRIEGLLEKEESYSHSVGVCYRCGTKTEPYLSRQWFVRMDELAKPAMEAVKKREIRFYPERWTNAYLSWMANIRPWCISRQLWWGHPIPVWYCKDMSSEECSRKDGIIVSREKPDKCPYCGSENLVQDTDVLDTWFSSWLWPFSTLGWPNVGRDFEYFYPTDLLVTGPEIIFFWVARMIMGSYFFVGTRPFRDVYIHGTVRDRIGRKMSKSLGNGIDPVDILKQYGTDALRFSILAVAGEGQDPRIEKRTFELGRNFCNKLWNAKRLLEILKNNFDSTDQEVDLADRWITSRLYGVISDVNRTLKSYRLHEAVMSIYDFFWHEYCDFYLEILKETGHIDTGFYVFDEILRLLHPFMPFITEELNFRDGSLMISKYPEDGERDKEAEDLFRTTIEIVTDIRNAKTSFGIPVKRKIPVHIKYGSLDLVDDYIRTLSYVEDFLIQKPKEGIRRTSHEYEVTIPLIGLVDIQKEKTRLEKEIPQVERLLEKTKNNLSNEDFLKKADPQVIENTELKKEELDKKLKLLKQDLSDFTGE